MNGFLPLESKLKAEGFFVIAGIDEAGRGPLAGPVVSAAVILKEDCNLPGLKDSKLLTEKKRLELFPRVIDSCIDYAITLMPPQIIDEVNILNATRLANLHCIESLQIKPDIILCDGKDKQFLERPFINIIKGDQKIKSIAAASILAKVTRDHLMHHYHTLYPQYQFIQHLGYGTRQHRAILTKVGPSPIHRKSFSFKPTT